jgi:WD40 repeat protein
MKFNYFLYGVCALLLVIIAPENRAQVIAEEFVVDHSPIIDFEWSPDGDFLAVSDADEIQVIDMDEQEVVRAIPVSSQYIQSIAWNVDGSLIAAYSLTQNAILVFDVQTTELTYRIEGDARIKEQGNFLYVNDVIWNACGLFSINGSIDLFLWGDSEYLPEPLTLSGHRDVVINTAMSDDCQFVVTSATDHTMRIWSILSGENILSLDGIRAFTVGDDRITYISTENMVVESAWSQESAHVLYALDPNEQVWFLDWSGDGDFLAFTTGDITILSVSPETAIVVTLSAEDRQFEELRWNPSRPLLATADYSRVVSVWNLESAIEEG